MDVEISQEKELGRELARVREEAGLTQGELAGRLGVSQTVVSRTESGERHLQDEELQRVASAVGTELAAAIPERRDREWGVLTRPPLGHPDHDLLWKAELAARELVALLGRPDVALPFARRIEGLLDELRVATAQLLNRACDLVFIGKVGVGKTTAICGIGGLVVARAGTQRDAVVLDVAGGRTTLCEVRITTGPTAITIEPCSDAEVRAYVAEFADKVLYTLGDDRPKRAEQAERTLASEVEKAIRNIAGLARPRGKDAKGRLLPDPAKELAREILAEDSSRRREDDETSQRLQFEVLSRMRMERRERREVRFEEGSGLEPLAWLKSEFRRINIGTNPEFTLPRRIHVSVDVTLIPGVDGVDARIVDTKGIDETVARADLEGHFGASHTVVVLCSGFNDAPCTEAVDLLERAREVGIAGDGVHGMLLGLPKFDEALQMRDDAGEPAATAEEGYDLKGEVVEGVVHDQIGFRDFSVQFFNSHEDDADEVRRGLAGRIEAMFNGYRRTISDLVDGAGTLVENYEDEQIQEILRDAMKLVRSWVEINMKTGAVNRQIERNLMTALESTHPSTIHASMRRRGGWYNLDYSHHLAFGARLVVSSVLRQKIESFGEHCETFLKVPGNDPARSLLDQAQRAMAKAYSTVQQRAQLLGETWFHEELERDDPLWSRCVRRWGMGEGYVSAVAKVNDGWFSEHQAANERLRVMVEREWQQAMAVVLEMLAEE